jgi:predicted ribosome quality control (RQC) complex YloA/Tae2 family protein
MFRRPGKDEMTGKVFLPPEPDLSKFEKQADWKIREFDLPELYKKIPEPSFNQQIDFWYSEHASTLSRQALLEKAEKWYNTTKNKRLVALNDLEAKLASFENAPMFKHQGDIILAYGYLIDGNSNFLECEDYESGKTVKILIDPKKSAQENAAEYYKNYKKAQSGSEDLKHDIEVAKNQLEKLENLYQEILNEQNPVKIEQLLRKDSTPKQQQKKTHPGLDYNVNGWYILVGRDANENDELLRHHVRGDDLWLHVRDFPGGYVFIKNKKGKTVPLDILLDAANLAVYYSKARNTGKTDLYYTHVKYLRRAKNGPKGLVLPSQEKNLCIEPDKNRLLRLDSLHRQADI